MQDRENFFQEPTSRDYVAAAEVITISGSSRGKSRREVSKILTYTACGIAMLRVQPMDLRKRHVDSLIGTIREEEGDPVIIARKAEQLETVLLIVLDIPRTPMPPSIS